MASRNCPVAVMKTARWWPWDLPSWRPPTALGQVWGIAVSLVGGGQVRSA
jgi:hypothetical protein